MESQEGQLIQQEGANQTFIVLVAALSGLLVLGIGAFVAWMVFVAPNMQADITSQHEAIFATNTAVAVAAASTLAAADTPVATDAPARAETPAPTDTPVPTDTPTPPPATDTPTPEPTATVASGAGGNNDSVAETVPETGVGVLGGAALGAGLAFMLVLIRRLRTRA